MTLDLLTTSDHLNRRSRSLHMYPFIKVLVYSVSTDKQPPGGTMLLVRLKNSNVTSRTCERLGSTGYSGEKVIVKNAI